LPSARCMGTWTKRLGVYSLAGAAGPDVEASSIPQGSADGVSANREADLKVPGSSGKSIGGDLSTVD
jgi:hypothetical protein